ncbi:MAG: BamA/TamA family outer membrane protein [Ignavibacteria bacterium]|nr:BamA/TamA family outer membrane protein [Ignavibacteria bacterium]
MHRLVSTAVIAALSFSLLCGQTQQNEKDSLTTPSARLFPLPILFYTPETGIAGGAAVMYLYRERSSTRASSITGDVVYSQKKQIIVEAAVDQYFDRGTYRLLGNLSFQKYPNKFFGIGNNTASGDEELYTPQSFLLRAVLYRSVYVNINVGPMIRYETVAMRETNPAGLLAPGTINGSKGGTAAGVGFVANWDSRDNTFSAHSGSFYQITGLFYRSAFGSDYDYTDIQIDTRKFFEVAPGQVVALQGTAEFIDGLPPFQSLATFGGSNILRGYYYGRYRDKNGVALQAEYRIPVWGRFGLVGFSGVAQVADRISHFGLGRFWFAGGAGVRFAWDPEERINLRLDFGLGNNSTGMYITATEAF